MAFVLRKKSTSTPKASAIGFKVDPLAFIGSSRVSVYIVFIETPLNFDNSFKLIPFSEHKSLIFSPIAM